MAENLTIKYDCWGHAFIAHSQRVGLVVLAVVIHLIAHVLHESTVLALRVRRMALLALLALLDDPVVKAFMLEDSLVSFHAVWALATRWMLTQVLESRSLCILLGHTETVHALLVRAMSAFRLLILFIRHRSLCCGAWRCDWLLRCIDHLFISLLSVFLLFFGFRDLRMLFFLSLRLCFLHRCQLDILVADMDHVTILKTNLGQGCGANCFDGLSKLVVLEKRDLRCVDRQSFLEFLLQLVKARISIDLHP